MSQDVERVYTINLGKVLLSPDNQRAKRAVNMIKEFARHHMKIEQVKLEEDVSHLLWARGIRHPPRKIRVRMTKTDEGYVLVSIYEGEEESIKEEEKKVETEPAAEPEPEYEGNSHLFAVRTTGGQEKIVMRLLEARIKMGKINIQSVLLLSDLKGYVVVESQDVSTMFDAIQGIRHVRGQLRGELTYNEIDKYLIKKSTVSQLAVENTVEIIAGPFKGMKATVTRLDIEKEEATVILLDATYQLPVTVDANYLKLVPA